MYFPKEGLKSINEDALRELIDKRRVNTLVLREYRLDTIESIHYLYLYDEIELSEISEYWNLNKSWAYRKITRKKSGRNILLKNKLRNDHRMIVNPGDIFKTVYDYEEFLIWRSERVKKKLTLTVNEASAILGLGKRHIRKLIKEKKLIAKKSDEKGEYNILRASFIMYANEILLGLRKRIRKVDSAVKNLKSCTYYSNEKRK
jgi:excisionase family DNA binding protein